MKTTKTMKKVLTVLPFCLFTFLPLSVNAQAEYGKDYIKRIGEKSSTFVSRRPAEKDRLFRSEVIDKKIKEVQKLLKDNPKLAWMFGNCFPNTLETTVHYSNVPSGSSTTIFIPIAQSFCSCPRGNPN